ncbi:hypothetical protein EXW26_28155 (plasmid) [Bacillus mycoides]|uniref:hypothetical protein n=1 Tax=Bacillus mycoides TaxID=1405 RepID=UPI001C036A1D|nr:hypothetical protein [Bacillus mycoides]QWG59213.1 hypothetical protein EXW26_28155 [Bacillus mycoides]
MKNRFILSFLFGAVLIVGALLYTPRDIVAETLEKKDSVNVDENQKITQEASPKTDTHVADNYEFRVDKLNDTDYNVMMKNKNTGEDIQLETYKNMKGSYAAPGLQNMKFHPLKWLSNEEYEYVFTYADAYYSHAPTIYIVNLKTNQVTPFYLYGSKWDGTNFEHSIGFTKSDAPVDDFRGKSMFLTKYFDDFIAGRNIQRFDDEILFRMSDNLGASNERYRQSYYVKLDFKHLKATQYSNRMPLGGSSFSDRLPTHLSHYMDAEGNYVLVRDDKLNKHIDPEAKKIRATGEWVSIKDAEKEAMKNTPEWKKCMSSFDSYAPPTGEWNFHPSMIKPEEPKDYDFKVDKLNNTDFNVMMKNKNTGEDILLDSYKNMKGSYAAPGLQNMKFHPLKWLSNEEYEYVFTYADSHYSHAPTIYIVNLKTNQVTPFYLYGSKWDGTNFEHSIGFTNSDAPVNDYRGKSMFLTKYFDDFIAGRNIQRFDDEILFRMSDNLGASNELYRVSYYVKLDFKHLKATRYSNRMPLGGSSFSDRLPTHLSHYMDAEGNYVLVRDDKLNNHIDPEAKKIRATGKWVSIKDAEKEAIKNTPEWKKCISSFNSYAPPAGEWNFHPSMIKPEEPEEPEGDGNVKPEQPKDYDFKVDKLNDTDFNVMMKNKKTGEDILLDSYKNMKGSYAAPGLQNMKFHSLKWLSNEEYEYVFTYADAYYSHAPTIYIVNLKTNQVTPFYLYGSKWNGTNFEHSIGFTKSDAPVDDFRGKSMFLTKYFDDFIAGRNIQRFDDEILFRMSDNLGASNERYRQSYYVKLDFKHLKATQYSNRMPLNGSSFSDRLPTHLSHYMDAEGNYVLVRDDKLNKHIDPEAKKIRATGKWVSIKDAEKEAIKNTPEWKKCISSFNSYAPPAGEWNFHPSMIKQEEPEEPEGDGNVKPEQPKDYDFKVDKLNDTDFNVMMKNKKTGEDILLDSYKNMKGSYAAPGLQNMKFHFLKWLSNEEYEYVFTYADAYYSHAPTIYIVNLKTNQVTPFYLYGSKWNGTNFEHSIGFTKSDAPVDDFRGKSMFLTKYFDDFIAGRNIQRFDDEILFRMSDNLGASNERYRQSYYVKLDFKHLKATQYSNRMPLNGSSFSDRLPTHLSHYMDAEGNYVLVRDDKLNKHIDPEAKKIRATGEWVSIKDAEKEAIKNTPEWKKCISSFNSYAPPMGDWTFDPSVLMLKEPQVPEVAASVIR